MWLMGAAAVAAGVIARVVLPKAGDLRVSQIELPIPGLSPSLEGYTIGALSDLHHWPRLSHRRLERAIAALTAARPDAVVLLGDYGLSWKGAARRANGPLYRAAMRELTPVLRSLDAPDGVLAVLGNHDHYFDACEVAAWLRGAGVRPLVNECAVVRRGPACLVVAGVDDLLEGRVDPAGGAGGCPADVPTVLLAHHPDSVLHLTAPRRVDLVLSGHTHGGQYVLPGYGAPVTLSEVCGPKTASGWVPNARAPLYVSRGVGEQSPGRLNCPPEVLVVRLRTAESCVARGA
jgi:predicted MPP superfamily phosphohydrolase